MPYTIVKSMHIFYCRYESKQ